MNLLNRLFRRRDVAPPAAATKRVASEDPMPVSAAKKVKHQLYNELDHAHSPSDVTSAWRRAILAIEAQRPTADELELVCDTGRVESVDHDYLSAIALSSLTGVETSGFEGFASEAAEASVDFDGQAVSLTSFVFGPQYAADGTIQGATATTLDEFTGQINEPIAPPLSDSTPLDGGPRAQWAIPPLSRVVVRSLEDELDKPRPLWQLWARSADGSVVDCVGGPGPASDLAIDIAPDVEASARAFDSYKLAKEGGVRLELSSESESESQSQSQIEDDSLSALSSLSEDDTDDYGSTSEGYFCAVFDNQPSDDSGSDFDSDRLSYTSENETDEDSDLIHDAAAEASEVNNADSDVEFYKGVRKYREYLTRRYGSAATDTESPSSTRGALSGQASSSSSPVAASVSSGSGERPASSSSNATAALGNGFDRTSDKDLRVTAVFRLANPVDSLSETEVPQASAPRENPREFVVVSDSSSEDDELVECELSEASRADIDDGVVEAAGSPQEPARHTDTAGDDIAGSYTPSEGRTAAAALVGDAVIGKPEAADEKPLSVAQQQRGNSEVRREVRFSTAPIDDSREAAAADSSDSAPEEYTTRIPAPATWDEFWAAQDSDAGPRLHGSSPEFDGEVNCMLSNGAKVYVYALEGYENAKRGEEKRLRRKAHSKDSSKKHRSSSHGVKKGHAHRHRAHSEKAEPQPAGRHHKRKHLRWHDE